MQAEAWILKAVAWTKSYAAAVWKIIFTSTRRELDEACRLLDDKKGV
jgi:hypothetical protein